jgi:hypothetical protein
MEILTPFGCTSGCTWLLLGVKISISTDRNVNNYDFHCGIKSLMTFIMVPTEMSNKYARLIECLPMRDIFTGHCLLPFKTFIFFAYSFQQQRKRHFYVVHRGPKCLIFYHNRGKIRYLRSYS